METIFPRSVVPLFLFLHHLADTFRLDRLLCIHRCKKWTLSERHCRAHEIARKSQGETTDYIGQAPSHFNRPFVAGMCIQHGPALKQDVQPGKPSLPWNGYFVGPGVGLMF